MVKTKELRGPGWVPARPRPRKFARVKAPPGAGYEKYVGAKPPPGPGVGPGKIYNN